MNEKIIAIAEQIKSLSILEAFSLINLLENEFGIKKRSNNTENIHDEALTKKLGDGSAEGSIEKIQKEEKTIFEISLIEVPSDKKLGVLKAVRQIVGLGLKESKDFVENTPKILKDNITQEECLSIKKEIESAGGKVLIK
jgi:large subunit ribosomal protein L7/L12